MYQECGHKYNLHYNEKIRPTVMSSPLLFGSAMDQALNLMLEGATVEESLALFTDKMTHVTINGVDYNIIDTPEVVKWTKSDVEPLISEDPRLSLLGKGKLAIEAYKSEVMPHIKRVITVQKSIEIKSADGDVIRGALDLVVEWEDGRILLLDNKTTSKPYDTNSAEMSPQLNLYYWANKDEFKLDGVGFITLSKKINRNEIKVCEKCGFDGSGQRFKTCTNQVDGKRCGGKWQISYKPKCDVQIIINDVNEKVLDNTFEQLDKVNQGIADGIFQANKKSCYNFGKCVYFDLCHKGSMANLVKLPEKDEKKDS